MCSSGVFYDFLQTAAEIAGVLRLPKHLDGYSLVPTLRHGDGAQPQPEFVYHEFCGGCEDPLFLKLNITSKCGQNIRYGNWSGVCVGETLPCSGKAPGRFFLYNMSIDQSQLHDVTLAHPDIVNKVLTIMAHQYDKEWPESPHPTPPPPPPPTPAQMPPPCTRGKASLWWGKRGNIYGIDLKSNNTVQLYTTDECCAWDKADGKFFPTPLEQRFGSRIDSSTSRASVGGTLQVVAVGQGGPAGKFSLNNTGTLSADGCTIEWSHRWAPWVRMAE